jgi:hypothetical protein
VPQIAARNHPFRIAFNRMQSEVEDMEKRFSVRTDKIPTWLLALCFQAWVNDAEHADCPEEGASISWHQSLSDAHTVCDMLNVADRTQKAIRRVGSLNNSE